MDIKEYTDKVKQCIKALDAEESNRDKLESRLDALNCEINELKREIIDSEEAEETAYQDLQEAERNLLAFVRNS